MLGMLASLGSIAASKAMDAGSSYLNSANSFAWNGKDLHRQIRYQKRMINFQNEQTKGMSLWSAKEMPAATMAGLKRAGLNPLLTAGGSTNVAPMVASSAASVPYSESYTPNTSSVDSEKLADIFRGNTDTAKQVEKEVGKTTLESTRASRAEQEARRKFFESDEGRKAVRDRLRMDYGPQTLQQQITLGAHTAADAGNAIPGILDTLFGHEETTNPILGFLGDHGRGVLRSDATVNASRKRKWSKRDSHNRIDNSRHNEYHFHFGGSAKGVKSDKPPVWTNPDLTPYRP